MEEFVFTIEEYIRELVHSKQPECAKDWKRVFDDMAVHTRKRRPDDLLLKTRPNEDSNVMKYRLDNYEAITYGSMNRALDQIYRMLSGSGYSYEVEQAVSDYLKERVFMDEQGNVYSFREYMEAIVPKQGIEDPNGFIVWVPAGEGLTNSAKPIRSTPVIVYSSQVWDLNKDIFTWLSNEKSTYSVKRTNGKTVNRAGKIYYTITRDDFWKITEVDADKYTGELIYKHGIGEVPAIVFGGDKNADGYFESFFAPYNAFGNQAIRQFSDWQAIMVTSAFPIREEFQIECAVAFPTDHASKTNPATETEETFDGDNRKNAFIPKAELAPMPRDPYGTIRRKVPFADGSGIGEAILPAEVPSVRFIYPDQGVAEYSGKAWDMLIDRAEDALHLNLGEGKNLSGDAKEKDLENRYAMIDKIAKRYFDALLYNSLRYVSAYYLNKPAKDVVVTVIKPADFKIKSEEDLINEIGLLREKKAPAAFLSGVMSMLSKKMFAGDRVMLKIFDVLPYVDPLQIYTTEEKTSMQASSMIRKEDAVRSAYAFAVLQGISRTMGPDVFIKASDDAILKAFEAEIIKYMPAAPSLQFDENGNPIPPGPPVNPVPPPPPVN